MNCPICDKQPKYDVLDHLYQKVGRKWEICYTGCMECCNAEKKRADEERKRQIKQNNENWTKEAMEKTGLKPGDRVQWDNYTWLGTVAHITGTVKLKRNGFMYVQMDNNRNVRGGRGTNVHMGWRKIENQ